jgi:Asp-tRNA(Asn)/Glu-tRNA(Gln) amidotransferase B subunit
MGPGSFNAAPNCPADKIAPGMLPLLNKSTIDTAFAAMDAFG